MSHAAVAVHLDREYETIFILKSDVTRESSEGISNRLTEAVTREGGTLTRIENWGRRRLAYPVGKQRRGVYVYLKYVGRGGLVSEIERNLRLLDDVVKYQTVMVRADVERASLVVTPEDLKFEHVEEAPDADVDDSRARMLGLEDRPDHRDGEGEHRGRHGFDDAEESAEIEGSDEEGMGDEEEDE